MLFQSLIKLLSRKVPSCLVGYGYSRQQSLHPSTPACYVEHGAVADVDIRCSLRAARDWPSPRCRPTRSGLATPGPAQPAAPGRTISLTTTRRTTCTRHRPSGSNSLPRGRAGSETLRRCCYAKPCMTVVCYATLLLSYCCVA